MKRALIVVSVICLLSIPAVAEENYLHHGVQATILVADVDRAIDGLAQWAEESADWDWKAALRQRQDEGMVVSVRLGTSRGRPLGSDGFVSKLEKLVGLRLRPLPVGRPPRKRKKRTKK